jgi:hypothetical protein
MKIIAGLREIFTDVARFNTRERMKIGKIIDRDFAKSIITKRMIPTAAKIIFGFSPSLCITFGKVTEKLPSCIFATVSDLRKKKSAKNPKATEVTMPNVKRGKATAENSKPKIIFAKKACIKFAPKAPAKLIPTKEMNLGKKRLAKINVIKADVIELHREKRNMGEKKVPATIPWQKIFIKERLKNIFGEKSTAAIKIGKLARPKRKNGNGLGKRYSAQAPKKQRAAKNDKTSLETFIRLMTKQNQSVFSNPYPRVFPY